MSEQRSALAGTWWLVLLYGMFVGLIGILLIIHPEKTLPVLVAMMGIIWLIQGIFMLGSSFMGGEGWGWRLIGGAISAIAGFVIVANPAMGTVVTTMMLVYMLAFSAIFNGIAEMFTGKRIGQIESGWSWSSFFLGVLHVVIGVFLLSNSLLSASALVLAIGFLAILAGVGMVVFSFKLKSAVAA